MRSLIAAAAVILGLLLPVSPASAKKNRSDETIEETPRKPKRVAKKAASNDDGVKRGRKRSPDDPVLRRYGKKATYVAITDRYSKSSDDDEDVKPVAKSVKKAKAKPVATDKDDVVVKKPAKKLKAKPAPVEEEIVIIEEPPAKKPKPAKKSKPVVEDDEDEITIIEE